MENYYEVQAISNSGMSNINPEQGGSPAKYKRFVLDRDKPEDDTATLKNGKLIHKYIEDKDAFKVADITKPSEMMSEWVEEVWSLVDTTFPKPIINEESDTLRLIVMSARGERYKSMKEDTVCNKFFKEGLEYLTFLESAQDKHVITDATREILEGVIQGIENKPKAKELLFGKTEQFGDVVLKEFPIYWTETVDDIELSCKGLIDQLNISPENKTVDLIDGKTSSKPGSKFADSMRSYRYYRQLAWYKRGILKYLAKEYPEITDWKFTCWIITFETTGLYECHVYKVLNDWLCEGQREYSEILSRIAYHTKASTWELTIEEGANGGFLNMYYDKD